MGKSILAFNMSSFTRVHLCMIDLLSKPHLKLSEGMPIWDNTTKFKSKL